MMLGVNLCCIAGSWKAEEQGVPVEALRPAVALRGGNEPLCAGCCPGVAAGNSIAYDMQEVTWDALLLLSR